MPSWVLAALLIALLACSDGDGSRRLVGSWEGGGEALESVRVRFEADGRFRLAWQDAAGRPFSLTGDYEVDFSKAPAPLTIRNIPRLPHPLHTIVEFRGPDALRMGGFAPRWRLRPVAFDPATQILLERRRAAPEPGS